MDVTFRTYEGNMKFIRKFSLEISNKETGERIGVQYEFNLL
jgi:hypothetical protein